MPDHITPQQRSYNMSRIRGKATKPELLVRQWLWSHGYRYRLNVKSVPGKPDIVLRKYRTAIFVNGCFWHGHEGCSKYVVPKSNTEFWLTKIERNKERDQKEYKILEDAGWHVIVIWECQLKKSIIESTMHDVEHMLNRSLLELYKP
jgi:DNA mismatch endonuclease (patch repair protein)